MPFRRFPRPRKKSSLKSQELFGAPVSDAPIGYLVAHVDGGARGNPGPAGYGVVVEDEKGRKIAELSEFLGHRTNNYAEYRGLMAAVEYARAHGHRALRVLSDSELLVRQMKGIYKVRHPELRELYDQVQRSLRELDWFRIEHVRREQNCEADRLANEAMDRGKTKTK